MHGLRSSLSIPRHRKNNISHENSSTEDNNPNDAGLRSSLDTLSIHDRSQYYPDEDCRSIPTEIDLQIAASLLGDRHSRHSVDCISFVDIPSSSASGSPRGYVHMYNYIAKQQDISELGISAEYPSKSEVSMETRKPSTRNWLLQRLSRKSSVASLVARRPQVTSKCLSLDDTCRLGGVSIFSLPRKYTATQLEIPTCLAATGNYMVKNGRGTSGIFRIPGQASIVNALHNYYTIRMTREHSTAKEVQTTIGSKELPIAFSANIHDVASAFKRFLWDLPGGVLGSAALFKAFKEIDGISTSETDTGHGNHSQLLKAHLVALALLSLTSRRRCALISAVFGLLAFLEQDAETMSAEALGVVFAPVLLGNLTEEIEIEGLEATQASSVLGSPKRSLLHHRKNTKSFKQPDCIPEISAGLERTNKASSIVEFLIRNWKTIVRQFQAIEIRSGMLSKSTGNLALGLCPILHEGNENENVGGLPHRLHPRKSRSMSKSVSNPALGLYHFQSKHGTFDPPAIGGSRLISRSVSFCADSQSRCPTNFSPEVSTTSRKVSLATTTSSSNKGKRWPSYQSSSELSAINEFGHLGENYAWWETRSTDFSTKSLACRMPRPATSGGLEAVSALITSDITTDQAHSGSVSCLELGDSGSAEVEVKPCNPECLQEDTDRPGARHLVCSSGLDSVLVSAPCVSGRSIADIQRTSPRDPSWTASTEIRESDSTGSVGLSICDEGGLEEVFHRLSVDSTGVSSKKQPSLIPIPISYKEPIQNRFYRSDLQDPKRSLAGTRVLPPAPLLREPTVACNVKFRTSGDARKSLMKNTNWSGDSVKHLSSKANMGTLYAEIGRLRGQLDSRLEETQQLRQQLDVIRRLKDAGTLSEKLRETDREMRFWKHRAQWAEKRLFGKNGGSEAA